MKKKAFLATALSLVFLILLPPNLASATPDLPRFVDEANLLTDAQASALTAKLDDVSARYSFDVVVVSIPGLDNRDVFTFARDFYLENGFGDGSRRDGAILLISMEDRDFAFVTFGRGIEIFTEAGEVYLDKHYLPDLKNDNYNDAFHAFADACEKFIIQANTGHPFDTGNIPLTPSEVTASRIMAGTTAVVIALIIALIATSSQKRKLKSVRKQDAAAPYIRQGSMAVTAQQDRFLHSTVSQERISSSDDSDSSGRTISSSAGVSSTGHSGKF